MENKYTVISCMLDKPIFYVIDLQKKEVVVELFHKDIAQEMCDALNKDDLDKELNKRTGH